MNSIEAEAEEKGIQLKKAKEKLEQLIGRIEVITLYVLNVLSCQPQDLSKSVDVLEKKEKQLNSNIEALE